MARDWTLSAAIGQRIRARREALKMSRKRLADECASFGPTGIKITESVIVNIELARRDSINIDELDVLRQVLGVTWDYLIFDAPEMAYMDSAAEVLAAVFKNAVRNIRSTYARFPVNPEATAREVGLGVAAIAERAALLLTEELENEHAAVLTKQRLKESRRGTRS